MRPRRLPCGLRVFVLDSVNYPQFGAAIESEILTVSTKVSRPEQRLLKKCLWRRGSVLSAPLTPGPSPSRGEGSRRIRNSRGGCQNGVFWGGRKKSPPFQRQKSQKSPLLAVNLAGSPICRFWQHGSVICRSSRHGFVICRPSRHGFVICRPSRHGSGRSSCWLSCRAWVWGRSGFPTRARSAARGLCRVRHPTDRTN